MTQLGCVTTPFTRAAAAAAAAATVMKAVKTTEAVRAAVISRDSDVKAAAKEKIYHIIS